MILVRIFEDLRPRRKCQEDFGQGQGFLTQHHHTPDLVCEFEIAGKGIKCKASINKIQGLKKENSGAEEVAVTG